MTRARRDSVSRRRRGGILLEVVLSIALFGGAAAFAIVAVRSIFATLDRTRRQQEAVDLAKSKLAELEAGLVTLADLRSGAASPLEAQAGGEQRWTFDLKTHRTEFSGLTLVELTVREGASSEDDPAAMRYTLRQLVALRPSHGEIVETEDATPPAEKAGKS